MRAFIHSFCTLQWWCVFMKHKISVLTKFVLHRLNGNTFWVLVYRQYTWYLKMLRYGSLVIELSNFAGRHLALVADKNGPHFYTPVFRGTYYGMVMSVRPSVRPSIRPSGSPSVSHSFPHFSPTCFDILSWNFACHILLMNIRSRLSAVNFRQFL